MTIYGCGFNGFNQLLQFGNGFITESENDTCVSTLRKLHDSSNPTETSGISEHPQSIPLNNAHPKEFSLSAISVGWDKIAVQFG